MVCTSDRATDGSSADQRRSGAASEPADRPGPARSARYQTDPLPAMGDISSGSGVRSSRPAPPPPQPE